MKILKTTVTTILAVAMILGGVFSSAEALAAPANQEADNTLDKVIEYAASGKASGIVDNANTSIDKAEEQDADVDDLPVMPSETNSFVKDVHYVATPNDSPFFDSTLPIIEKNIKEYNKHSVTPAYDALPVANNPENFQGLGSTTFTNINGETVTAEAFYRVYGDSLHDPNYGMGILLYQCIQYKRAYPEEDVKVTFSSYRTSVTASVCVIPNSKYYGYMRSLYGTNYDEQGFVRISYMLMEAARMGIEVTMINHLPSYAVSQYNPTTGKNQSRNHIDFKNYFTSKAMNTSCYSSYVKEEGKTIKDFFNYVAVDWTVNNQTSNMQHVKGLSVSHYLATDGTTHKNAVFFCTANLDENNYKGCNGNGYSQSGVIISDHAELFRINYNYSQLMAKYPHKEGIYELRMVVTDMNNEQIALINAGREDEIPEDEQIVYLGSETDKVFELYFTPLGGGTDVWDGTYNPLCKYIGKLPTSEGYVEYASNQYGYGRSYVGYTIERMLEAAYCNSPDPNNKISIKIVGFDTSNIQKLELGVEIGYRSIKDSTRIHAKDHLMSYVENGQRHYVSILTSCNLYMIAFNYRTNSILVIHETEETDNGFYTALGPKFTDGMIKADQD